MPREKIKTYRDLIVYTKSFDLAMELFRLTSTFPREEKYGLTDQIRRASRSIPANIAEGWAKRTFENIFKRHLIDSSGSCEETMVWLEFSFRCNYIDSEKYNYYSQQYDEVGKMLFALHDKWCTYK
ncbi:MAG TPA: four helix bundle protein [Rectinema sp.]|nr:four helix bundle protein [Myxococcales bacterium]HQB07427.1 four helix bundle protein [Rectinema sp.]